MAPAVTEEQIRGIYAETIEALYGFVSRRCGGDRDLAEDVTQETWLRAVRAWRTDGPPANPIGWLTTVARNLMLNQLRRRPAVRLDGVDADDVLAAVDSGSVSESESAVLVSQALERLPARQSRLLEAFYFDHCRTAQIAASLNLSERAVEGRLRRARESLRRELEATVHAHGGLR